MKLFNRYTPLQAAVHGYAWSALLWIGLEWTAGTFSINPIQELEQRTGRHAITLLMLSLMCTPINTLFKWSEPIKYRRTLGLYAFLYAVLHVLIFVDLDYGLAWGLLVETALQKPYLIAGAMAFLALLPLAVTSFDIWKKRLGKNWKRLHQMVYYIAPIAVLHYAWSKKGDLFSLSGDILRPLIYGLILAALLAIRIPHIRKSLASRPARKLSSPPEQKAQPEADSH